MKFKEILDGVFDEGTEEYEVIKECYELITGTVPTVASEAKTHMILLDHTRTKLSTIYYLLSRNISKRKDSVSEVYNRSYARLVKLGRPSHAAIEAEIKANNSDYALANRKIEELEQVKDLVSSYIRCIDSNKQTTVELLKDSRRID